MSYTIKISDVVPVRKELRFDRPVQWEIGEGEQWAVIGPNGAGKTLLADLLCGRVLYREGFIDFRAGSVYRDIKRVEFRDIYTLVDCTNVYYQKRWNASDLASEPSAGEIFAGYPEEAVLEMLGVFGMKPLAGKKLISLSSGELRKMLIVRALLSEPRLLIIDNPFIGLDRRSRLILSEMLARMISVNKVQVILVVSDPVDIPDWIDMVLPLKGMSLRPSVSLDEFRSDRPLQDGLFGESGNSVKLPSGSEYVPDYDTVIGMRNVSVRYGENSILDGIDWVVKKGDKWALLGPNGSGKSTLLSLVNGDNPQAYANDITLFDRRRGTGESIWDIKRHIGYLNSDLHSYYLQDIAALEVVVSGFFDSIGLFRLADESRYDAARRWLGVFGVGSLAERSFLKLSYGEQRLVLLARTFVKDPEVLILDEPMHGLDLGGKKRVGSVIEQFCRTAGKTLIYVTHYADEIPQCVDKVKELP